MGVEIERKFLVVSDEWRENAAGVTYHQGYLCRDPQRTVRVRVAGSDGFVTIKGEKSKDGTSCPEFEYAIPRAEAQDMLQKLCLPGQVEKTRHKVAHGGMTWEVDEFHGDNKGLVIAEIELAAPGQVFDKPAWLGEEVTQDPRYSNAALSQNPYKNWKR